MSRVHSHQATTPRPAGKAFDHSVKAIEARDNRVSAR